MDIESTIYVGVGLGLATILAINLKKTESIIEIKEAVYDKADNKIKIHVSNQTPHAVYTQPILRKIVQREKIQIPDSVLNYMPAMRNEERTLYDMLGECEAPVRIPANSSLDLVFHLGENPHFKFDDTIHIDSQCGLKPTKLKANIIKDVPITIKEGEVVAKKQSPEIDEKKSREIIRNVVKTNTALPVLDAHPHLGMLVDGIGVELKPVHAMILHFLEMDGNLTSNDISRKIKKSPSTTRKYLKHLHDNNLLHRVKFGNAFQYMSLTIAVSQ